MRDVNNVMAYMNPLCTWIGNQISFHTWSTTIREFKSNFLCSKFALDMLHCFLAQSERFLQHNVADPRPE